MKDVDLRSGTREFEVPTKHDGYMGPDVKVTARDETHAKEIVKNAGYSVNEHFAIKEIKQR